MKSWTLPLLLFVVPGSALCALVFATPDSTRRNSSEATRAESLTAAEPPTDAPDPEVNTSALAPTDDSLTGQNRTSRANSNDPPLDDPLGNAMLRRLDPSERDPAASVDVAWERRLGEKSEEVQAFFARDSVTQEEWGAAYAEEMCACSTRECFAQLQRDFVAHAPPRSDGGKTEAYAASLDEAARCAEAVIPARGTRNGLSRDELNRRRAEYLARSRGGQR